MTAGRGIIHSEMPQQESGRMRGFQLWINLPAKEKMKPAGYRDIAPSEIPVVELADGGRVKVIAGAVAAAGRTIAGPIRGGTTDPIYLDVELPAGAMFRHELPRELQRRSSIRSRARWRSPGRRSARSAPGFSPKARRS